MDGYGNALMTGAAHRTGGELTSYLFQHWMVILIVVIIILAVLFPPDPLMSTVSACSKEFGYFEGEWYTREDDKVVSIEFLPIDDKIMLRTGSSKDAEPVEVEKPRMFSFLYPRISAKLRFRAVMPSGKLRAVNATVTDEQLCLDVANEEKITYYKDRRIADAMID